MDFSTENSEQKYLQLLQYIIDHGTKKSNRTGTDTYSVVGATLRFPLYDNKARRAILPALTTKQVFIKTALKELLWFISGSTNNNDLVKQDVHIWDDNSTRKFLDSRGLKKYPVGELGPIYGYQWRTWNMIFEHDGESGEGSGSGSGSGDSEIASSEGSEGGEGSGGINSEEDSEGEPVDQLAEVIENLKKDPLSRRHVVSAWNPEQLKEMALPPCHYAFQFVAEPVLSDPGKSSRSNYELHCVVTMRSGDMFLGVPFNVVSYAFLTHAVAHLVGMKPGTLTLNIADAHIYENHVNQCRVQIARAKEVHPYPWISIDRNAIEIKDIDGFTLEDFKIKNYKHHPAIKGKMAV